MDIDEIILENEKLIYKIINKYTKYFEIDDLYQVAIMGLVKASKNYNSNYQTKFISYAYPYIMGEVLKYINNSYNFKVSREYLKLNKKINEARNYLAQKLMKEVSDKEVASFLEIDENLISDINNNLQIFDSLNREIENDGKTLFLEDTIMDKKDNYNIDNILLNEYFSKLSKDEQKLLYERYYLDKTQSEVAKIFGINQVQVSRNEQKILKKIKANYEKISA